MYDPGLRLDEKRSTSECDGKYDGERLFRCKAGFGIFVPIEDVKALEEDDDGDDWEPLPGPAGSTIGGAYDPVDALHHVVGHSSAKDKIQAVVNALEVNKRRVAAGGRAEPAPHMVLVGNPGCGKSMLARLVAYIVSECDVSRHGPLIRPSRTDLVAVGRSPGRTAEQVAQQCEKAEGGVLLIDDFHRMLPVADAGNLRDTPGMEAMEAGYSPPPLVRSCGRSFVYPPPDSRLFLFNGFFFLQTGVCACFIRLVGHVAHSSHAAHCAVDG